MTGSRHHPWQLGRRTRSRAWLSLTLVAALCGCGGLRIVRVETWTLASPPFEGAKLSAHEGAVIRHVNEAESEQPGHIMLSTASGAERLLEFDRVVREGATGTLYTTYQDTKTGDRAVVRYSNHERRYTSVRVEARRRFEALFAPESVVSRPD